MNFKDENGIWQSILLEPSGDTFPIGAIARWAGDTAPNYWLFADGSNISRSTYKDLFDKIGTKFGEGDGSTTFGLPSIPDEDNFKFIIKAFQSIGVAGTLTEDINTTSPSDVLTAKKTKEYIDNAVSGVFIGDVKEAPDTVKLVVEPVEQDNVVQGKDLTINNTIENVAKAKVYGYTRQIMTTGQQLYNYKDTNDVTSGVTVDEDGWITATYDNTSGTSTKYLNYFTNNLELELNMNYLVVTEIKSVNGYGSLAVISNTVDSGQFSQGLTYDFEDLIKGAIKLDIRTTRATFLGNAGLRTFIGFSAGEKGSITFRLSVLKDTTVTEDNFVYESFSGGKPSPSPDYPQEVEVAKGNNILPTDISDWEQGTFTTQGANSNSTTRIRTIDYYSIKTGIDYYISVEATNYSFVNIFLYDKNKTFVVSYASIFNISGTRGTKINIPSSYDVSYMRVILQKSNATTITADEVETIKPMITKGSTKIDFEPYNSIVAKANGEQLLNLSEYGDNITKNGITLTKNEDGSITLNGTASANSSISISYKIPQSWLNKTLTLSSNNILFNGNFGFKKSGKDIFTVNGRVNQKEKTQVITQSLIDEVNIFDIFTASNTTYSNFNFKIMLNEGTIATEYEPYQESKLTYSLNDNFVAEQDYIQDNKLYKNVARVILNGSEEWVLVTSIVENTIRLYTEDIKNILNTSGVKDKNFSSNMFEPMTWGDIYAGNTTKENAICVYGVPSRIVIRISTKYATNVTTFKQWLSEHPVEVYYQLETPTTTNLEPIGELKTYKDYTNIFNNVNTEMEVKYYSKDSKTANMYYRNAKNNMQQIKL